MGCNSCCPLGTKDQVYSIFVENTVHIVDAQVHNEEIPVRSGSEIPLIAYDW